MRKFNRLITFMSGLMLVAMLLALMPLPVSAAATNEYSLAIPSGTCVVRGDFSAIIPITVINSASSSANIASVIFNFAPEIYNVARALQLRLDGA